MLVITDGTGYYHEKGKAVQIVQKGDVGKCLPGVEHWHGSTPEVGVTYLAISPKFTMTWLEPVTEETYQNLLQPTSDTIFVEKQLKDLSRQKWLWMAEKNTEALTALFHEKSSFIHMGGSWGKQQEIDIIENGGIWYKKAEIHEVSVHIIGNTAVLLNKIQLVAEVRGNVVVNPFMVTGVYYKECAHWKLTAMTFTKLVSLY